MNMFTYICMYKSVHKHMCMYTQTHFYRSTHTTVAHRSAYIRLSWGQP